MGTTPFNCFSYFKAAIVTANFNSLITESLKKAAHQAFIDHSADESLISHFSVPGAFELPLLCQELARSGQYHCIIALGAVIKGETPHFDFVASEAAKGIMNIGLQNRVPVIFGVLTTSTMEQAMDRAGGKLGNKGYDAALTGIQMANLLKGIQQQQ